LPVLPSSANGEAGTPLLARWRQGRPGDRHQALHLLAWQWPGDSHLRRRLRIDDQKPALVGSGREAVPGHDAQSIGTARRQERELPYVITCVSQALCKRQPSEPGIVARVEVHTERITVRIRSLPEHHGFATQGALASRGKQAHLRWRVAHYCQAGNLGEPHRAGRILCRHTQRDVVSGLVRGRIPERLAARKVVPPGHCGPLAPGPHFDADGNRVTIRVLRLPDDARRPAQSLPALWGNQRHPWRLVGVVDGKGSTQHAGLANAIRYRDAQPARSPVRSLPRVPHEDTLPGQVCRYRQPVRGSKRVDRTVLEPGRKGCRRGVRRSPGHAHLTAQWSIVGRACYGLQPEHLDLRRRVAYPDAAFGPHYWPRTAPADGHQVTSPVGRTPGVPEYRPASSPRIVLAQERECAVRPAAIEADCLECQPVWPGLPAHHHAPRDGGGLLRRAEVEDGGVIRQHDGSPKHAERSP